MEYHVELNGKTYNLPARTLEMDDRITMIRGLDRRVKSGEITRREARQEQYSFVTDCTGEPLLPLEQVDVGDLEISVVEIVNAYQRPAAQAKIEKSLESLRDLTERPEFKKMFFALDRIKP